MGLDLSISCNKTFIKKTTGVFIRENGMNKELKTIEEVKKYFPNSDISHIKEYEYESNNVFDKHITHNLWKMASKVVSKENNTLYYLLWRPEEIGFTIINESYIKNIKECLDYLIEKRKELEKYNPPNGFGSYESLYEFVKELYDCIIALNLKNDVYEIYASR